MTVFVSGVLFQQGFGRIIQVFDRTATKWPWLRGHSMASIHTPLTYTVRSGDGE